MNDAPLSNEAPFGSDPRADALPGARRAGLEPVIPTQRSGSYLDEPLPPEDDIPFTSSVMSDLKEPEPFIPEPYDPSAFTAPRAQARSADHDAQRGEAALPKRVPSVPDVPDQTLAEADPDFDQADGAERIVSFLREQYETGPTEARSDGYDLNAVIAAVQSVGGVSDARLRFNPGSGGHTLRIEFADGADETMVTQQVARILREKMGLDADPTALWLTSDDSTLDRPTPARGMRRPTVARAAVPAQAAGVGPRPPAPRVPVPELRPPSVLGGVRSDRRGQVPPVRVPRQAAEASGGSTQPLLAPGSLPLPTRPGQVGPRVVLEHFQVTTLGLDATVEVRLVVPASNGRNAARTVGSGQGPAVDAYLLRLTAAAVGDAVDQLLVDPGTGEPKARCFIENVVVSQFADCEVAVVVMLLVHNGFAEQLAGSAIVSGGDARQAVAKATLSAVNRRLESLLA